MLISQWLSLRFNRDRLPSREMSGRFCDAKDW